jgi:cold shock protein
VPKGTIKKLIADKGFGFISGERGELFFHHTGLHGVTIEELREGQEVEFKEGKGPKGPRAEDVRPAGVIDEDSEQQRFATGSETITVLVDPGCATADEISELLFELSTLYRMLGGSGISFVLSEMKEPVVV